MMDEPGHRSLAVRIRGVDYELKATHDTTRDGRADTALVDIEGAQYQVTDLGSDGVPDVVRVLHPDGRKELFALESATGRFVLASDSHASDSSVEEGASHWFRQATEFTCGPAAISMVLADLFDLTIADERSVWQRAIEMGAIDQRGMSAREIERVIESYGVPAEVRQSNLGDLARLLDTGHEAIIMVDAAEYWWPDGRFRGEADVAIHLPHAVRILSIDFDRNIAILCDSGRSDPRFGRLEVPLDTLEDAWEDIEFLAVVTQMTNVDIAAATSAPMPELGALHQQILDRLGSHAPTVFFPFLLRAQRIRALLDRRAGGGPAR